RHGVQLAPQLATSWSSTQVLVQRWRPGGQLTTLQVPPLQLTLLPATAAQSLAASHLPPTGQRSQASPPQSTSVSPGLCRPSAQRSKGLSKMRGAGQPAPATATARSATRQPARVTGPPSRRRARTRRRGRRGTGGGR